MPIFLIFQMLWRARKGQNLLWLLTWPEKHFFNHTKSVLVRALVKPFSWQSFKKKFFFRKFASGWFLHRQPLKKMMNLWFKRT